MPNCWNRVACMPSCTTPSMGEKQAVPFAEKRPNLTLFFTKLQKK